MNYRVMAKASIVSIGNELLNGHTTDTNATYISRQLLSIGVPVVSVYAVGADPQEGEAEAAEPDRGLADGEEVIRAPFEERGMETGQARLRQVRQSGRVPIKRRGVV